MSAVVTVGVAGLTHLGINSAVAIAARGFAVVGYDPDAKVSEALSKGNPIVVEPGLPEALKENVPRLRFTSEAKALGACDVIYIASDVRTDDAGVSDLGPLTGLIAEVAQAASPQASIVVLSQVPPGFTRGYAEKDKRFFYQVETLIFGRAYDRALNPERFIIGCAEPAAELPKAYAALLAAFHCPALLMRFESAELAKISINMCLVASIGVANTLAELCEHVGADWSEIVPALKLDARIGPQAYLAPGLGIAGGNLERDLATVMRLAAEHGTDAGIVKAWVMNSAHRRDWALARLAESLLERGADPLIGVLGLAYKENTASTKNSPSVALIDSLRGIRVRAYDPVIDAKDLKRAHLGGAASALAVCDGADALLLMTPWPEFRSLDPKTIAGRLKGRVVIDPYRLLDTAACTSAGLTHHVLGRAAA